MVRSGRAILHPIYKGTYERRKGAEGVGPNEMRDLKIAWSKDMGRSVDYLETRRDIDKEKLAYYGLSLGSITALPVLAIEERFKVAVLLAGGLPLPRVPPEADPVNFAPRIKIPVLLLGGRQDFIHPVETAQIPLFRMLGTPEKDKKHIIFEGGHAPLRIQPLIKDILDWLDRYLGPVKPWAERRLAGPWFEGCLVLAIVREGLAPPVLVVSSSVKAVRPSSRSPPIPCPGRDDETRWESNLGE